MTCIITCAYIIIPVLDNIRSEVLKSLINYVVKYIVDIFPNAMNRSILFMVVNYLVRFFHCLICFIHLFQYPRETILNCIIFGTFVLFYMCRELAYEFLEQYLSENTLLLIIDTIL